MVDGGEELMTDCMVLIIVYFLKIMANLCRKTALMATIIRMEMITLHLLLW